MILVISTTIEPLHSCQILYYRENQHVDTLQSTKRVTRQPAIWDKNSKHFWLIALIYEMPIYRRKSTKLFSILSMTKYSTGLFTLIPREGPRRNLLIRGAIFKRTAMIDFS